jgi:hypothetical protein
VSDTATRTNAEIADALASLPRDGPLVLITRAVVEEAILALRAPRVFTAEDVERVAATMYDAWNGLDGIFYKPHEGDEKGEDWRVKWRAAARAALSAIGEVRDDG